MDITKKTTDAYNAESNEAVNSSARFSCSRDIRDHIRLMVSKNSYDFALQEHIIVLGLNNKNEVISERLVALGSVDECNVSIPVLFKNLIVTNAARFVVVHNHPSDDVTQSYEDITLTERIISAGKLLGVPLLDHLIVDSQVDSYRSMRDFGLCSF